MDSEGLGKVPIVFRLYAVLIQHTTDIDAQRAFDCALCESDLFISILTEG